jgi:hypothetical protein
MAVTYASLKSEGYELVKKGFYSLQDDNIAEAMAYINAALPILRQAKALRNSVTRGVHKDKINVANKTK